MITPEQKVRFVECIQKGLHQDSQWNWFDPSDEGEFGDSEFFMMKIGNWYIFRIDHGIFGDGPDISFIEGTEKAIAAVKSQKNDGFDDVLGWAGDPEDVRNLPDFAASFGDGLTSSQIIKEIEEDEHLYLYARDPEYGELPDEYYGSVQDTAE